MGKTPYALAFSAKEQIPIESGLEPLCVFNLVELAQSLDELEEKREQVAIRMAEYQRCSAGREIRQAQGIQRRKAGLSTGL